jgi:hypothetical protein
VASVWLAHLCSPNEDFGSLNKALRVLFARIFNESSPKSSTHSLEKYFKNTYATLCSGFQNLRLGSMHFEWSPEIRSVRHRTCSYYLHSVEIRRTIACPPRRRFWKKHHTDGVITRFWRRCLENVIENARPDLVCSFFKNLGVGCIHSR